MIFSRGTRVEVMDPTHNPFPSWYPAVVLSGNATICNVKYDCAPLELSNALEPRVSVKLVRPCPPPVEFPRALVAGDVVEILSRGSWKRAKVVSYYSNGNHYVVLPLGYLRELKVHHSWLRLRQNWKKDKWVTIAKDLKKCKPPESHERVYHYQTPNALLKNQENNSFGKTTLRKNVRILGPRETPMKKSTRPRKTAVPNTKTTGRKQSSRANGIQQNQHKCSENSLQLSANVHNVILRCKMLEEEYMQISNKDMSRWPGSEMGQAIAEIRSLLTRSLEPYNHENDACSINCSFSGSNNPADMLIGQQIGADGDFDDCQSIGGVKNSRKMSTGEHMDRVANTRMVELRAYHSILETLYSSGMGRLTWEQEMLLTNLRATLHISNDDHIRELRQLKSGPSEPNC